MDRLAHHQAPVQHECKRDRMHLEGGSLVPNTKRQAIVRPAIVRPECHYGRETNRGWNGCTLEVLRLASGVLGKHGDGDVEAGEAGKAAEDEEGEKKMIEGGAQTKRECSAGRGDAEGDLCHGALAWPRLCPTRLVRRWGSR